MVCRTAALLPAGDRKFHFAEFHIQFSQSSSQALLDYSDGFVSDAWTYVGEHVVKQAARRYGSHVLVMFVAHVGLERLDGFLPVFLSEFDGHGGVSGQIRIQVLGPEDTTTSVWLMSGRES